MVATIATPQIDNTLFSERPVNLLMIWEAVDMVLILVVAGGGRCRLMTNEDMHLPCQTDVSLCRFLLTLVLSET